MDSKLAQLVNQALSDGQPRIAVARMENELMHRGRIAPGLLERIPESDRLRSPWLLKAYGEELLERGDPLAAAATLSAALKKAAERTLTEPMLSALALLAVAHLRLGHSHEAVPILRFLHDERTRAEAELSGDVDYALAHGIHLLGKEDAEPGLYYHAAANAYDREGEGAKGSLALFERIIRFGGRMARAELDEAMFEFEQRVRTNLADARLFDYLTSLRDYHEGRLEQAERTVQHCGMLPLPRPYEALGLLLGGRIAASRGLPENVRASLERLEQLDPESTVDVAWQYESACVRFELAAATRDIGQAKRLISQARALCRLGLPPEAQAELDRMQGTLARLEAEDKAETVQERSAWRANLFGEVTFSRDGEAVRDIAWKRRKTKELAVYLLLQPGYAAPRDRIADALFPDVEPDKIDNQLYVVAHQLRRITGDYLGIDGGAIGKDGIVRLKEGMIGEVDVEQYTSLVRVGDRLWPSDRELAARMYEQADPLYAIVAPDIPYADWLEEIRAQLLEMQCTLIGRLGRLAADVGQYERAETYFRRWIDLQPLHEAAHQELIRALGAQSKLAEAEYAYKRLERLLREELGIRPMPETLGLLRR